jgi:hypothetical protein
MRAAAWEKRNDSISMPFIKMTRTRVNASSSSLLIGLPASSRHVKRCRSSGVPRSSNKAKVMEISGDLQKR